MIIAHTADLFDANIILKIGQVMRVNICKVHKRHELNCTKYYGKFLI